MSVSGHSNDGGKTYIYSCSKHGDLGIAATQPEQVVRLGEIYQDTTPGSVSPQWLPNGQGFFPTCPRCEEVRKKDLCRECEKHTATVDFSNSAMDMIHGFVERICQCCFVARCEAHLTEVITNLAAAKEKLAANPCDPLEPDSL